MASQPLAQFDVRRLLEDLVRELQVPPSRYEEAESRYESLGQWLHRQDSTVRDHNPDVYVQGSFQLGTAIKPASEEEDYDIDMVCCLDHEKSKLTQAQLKSQVGYEIKAYAKRYHMSIPKEGRRCWTLAYADGAQFHMDILPSLPDIKKRQSLRMEGQNLARLGATALAITDKEHPHYRQPSEDWPRSNPKGYALWFRNRMGSVFIQRAQRFMEQQIKRSIEDVPTYSVETPLQGTVQLLKRHRDLMFSERSDEKPISILITTLAAHAYREEENIADALFSILQGMSHFIKNRQGVYWVQNPADPEENFADKWAEHPERRYAFFEWLKQAREDFQMAMNAPTAERAGNYLTQHLGTSLINRVLNHRNSAGKLCPPVPPLQMPDLILKPPHMRKPRWEYSPEGWVRISDATYKPNRLNSSPQNFLSGKILPKDCSLRFKAETSVTGHYTVYWQVVNTGSEAEADNGLRGDFDYNSSGLVRSEGTLYRGRHSIECFIIKNGKLAARSSQFIVHIA